MFPETFKKLIFLWAHFLLLLWTNKTFWHSNLHWLTGLVVALLRLQAKGPGFKSRAFCIFSKQKIVINLRNTRHKICPRGRINFLSCFFGLQNVFWNIKLVDFPLRPLFTYFVNKRDLLAFFCTLTYWASCSTAALSSKRSWVQNPGHFAFFQNRKLN